MSDLPIKVSSVSAKPVAGKPTVNSDAAQQGAQDFGNVLARQVADTPKPAESAPRSSGDTPQQAAENDKTETGRAEDSGNAVPADMLAALLAQQTQPAAAQSEVLQPTNAQTLSDPQAIPSSALPIESNPQSAKDAQAGANLSGAQGKTAKASPALLNGKANPANISTTEAGMAPAQPANLNPHGKGFADTFKTAALKDINTVSGNQPQRGTAVASELATQIQQQPTMMPLVTGAASSASPVSIDTAVNQPAWGDEFSQKITWMATQRNQSAELHLNPPQLGPLDVVLKMNGDQASATFTSPHAAVREAIEQAIPKLREMLADSGIMLGNAMVSDNAAKNNQDNSPRNTQGRSATSASSAANPEGGSIQEARVSPARRHNGMVDTFA